MNSVVVFANVEVHINVALHAPFAPRSFMNREDIPKHQIWLMSITVPLSLHVTRFTWFIESQ